MEAMNQPTDKSRWDFTFEVTPYDRKVFLFEYALSAAASGDTDRVNISGHAIYALKMLEAELGKIKP
jgi:hypothetical protein